MEDLIIAVIAEVFKMLSFCLKRSVKCQATLNMERNCPFAFSLLLINPGEHTVTSGFSVFPYSGKRYFSCSLQSIALWNGANRRECKAYWDMNYSLIDGCGACEK